MINYKDCILKVHKMLNQLDWPRVIFIPAEDYWAIVIASEGQITADWHFDGKEEDEGFAFFVLGPTMVRVCSRQSNTAEVYPNFDRRKK